MRKDEVKMNCLKEIERLTQEMAEIENDIEESRQISIVRELSQEQRLEYINKLQKIAKLRGDIACEYNVILSCQEIRSPENAQIISIAIEEMRDAQLVYEQQLEDSEDEMAKNLAYIQLVAGVNDAGYKFFNEKFDSVYAENSKVWAEFVKFAESVKQLNSEINNMNDKVVSTQEDTEPNA